MKDLSFNLFPQGENDTCNKCFLWYWQGISIVCSKMGASVILTGRNEERLRNVVMYF